MKTSKKMFQDEQTNLYIIGFVSRNYYFLNLKVQIFYYSFIKKQFFLEPNKHKKVKQKQLNFIVIVCAISVTIFIILSFYCMKLCRQIIIYLNNTSVS